MIHPRRSGAVTTGARRLALVCLILAVMAAARPVQAGTPGPASADPYLIKDLREGSRGSTPASLTAISNTVFFSANDGLSGTELWRTDPPYNTIQQVADVCRGGCSSEPTFLAAVGGTLFFNATDGKNGYELWRSDPPYTQASTFLVADINPDGDSAPAEMTPIGNSIFFTADDGEHGRELWRSSPPYQEAVRIEDIFPGGASSNPHDLTAIGWMLFFAADDSTGSEVWRSDPPYSAASTFKVTDINPEGSANVLELTPMELKLFFSATDGSTGQELYMIESPYLEAKRVTDVYGYATSSNPRNLLAVGSTLFFSVSILNSGVELYKSVPPYEPTSTTLVEDIFTGLDPDFDPLLRVPASSSPTEKYAIGTTLFFSARNKYGYELWKTEPNYLPSTTDIVMDINKGPGSSNPSALISVGSTLFFTANDGVYGPELWKSVPPYDDLSTEIVADIYRGVTGSDPHSPLVVDNTLFFAAGHAEYGKELFRYGGFYGMPNTGFAPGRVSAVKAQPADKAYRDMDAIQLKIPRLVVVMPVVGVPLSSDGWDLSWLSDQAGYLGGTAYPTWAGNTVLTGHVYLSNGAPGPFVGLGRLKYGDTLVLEAFQQRYLYEVRSVEVINPEDTEAVFQHEDLDWLTLVTCQNFDETSGSYRSRVVVRAVRVKVQPGE